MSNSNTQNAKALKDELDWFYQRLSLRTKITFELSEKETAFEMLRPPVLDKKDTPYSNFVLKYDLNTEERFLLILALIPHIKPAMLDILQLKNSLYDMPFTEFGGVKINGQKGFLPTGETALFLLAGDDLEKRLSYLPLFDNRHRLFDLGILHLEIASKNTPRLAATLTISNEFIPEIVRGEVFQPVFGTDFPAQRISTSQKMNDLVVDKAIVDGIAAIENYLDNGKKLKDEYAFGKKIKRGFRVLFTGPSGTGKTLTATLIGKRCKRDVYRIDLSTVVSKYIGETEKNLARVFDLAESKDWILFFDEADALFGKRTNTTDAHDRYANQGVSFLLQRVEDFDGLVILCSNFKKNIDEAFFRRFQAVLDFKLPNAQQRYALWENAITDEFEYENTIDLDEIAKTYELTGSIIINVLHYAILRALRRASNTNVLLKKDILTGIKNEKLKEGRSLL